MKKMFLVAAATVIATAGFSQVRFGVQVIGNAGSASIKTEEIKNVKKPKQVGFGAGVVADISLGEKFGIRPSINFLQKKSRIEYQFDELPGKPFSVNTTLNYLELPVNFVYKIPVGGANAFVGLGPSIGYGISGKLKAKSWIESEAGGDLPSELVELNSTVDAFKKESEDGAGLKRLDVSANATAGVQLQNGLYINAGYIHGLTNLSKEGSYKNQGITLTIGFLLPSGK